MRCIRWAGNLFLVFGLATAALAGSSQGDAWSTRIAETWPASSTLASAVDRVVPELGPREPWSGSEQDPSVASLLPRPQEMHPITRVRIPEIRLDTEVVPSWLEPTPGGATTWQVPAFKVGHAEGSGGAGQPGNAVLLGHVTSRSLGNVFLRLDQMRVDDAVFIGSDEETYLYRVEEILTVDRTDLSVVRPTDAATLTLLTCTGAWLAADKDYAERLVVRAALSATVAESDETLDELNRPVLP